MGSPLDQLFDSIKQLAGRLVKNDFIDYLSVIVPAGTFLNDEKQA